MTSPDRPEPEITVLVPEQPPVLTPAAARALLRLLQAADHVTNEPHTEEEQAA